MFNNFYDNLNIFIIVVLTLTFIFLILPKMFSSKYLFLFKNLFASWKLFDNSDYKLIVKYKKSNKADELDNKDWIEYQNKTRLKIYNLFWNPKGNLMLSFNSTLSSLANELSENEINLKDNFSYNILKQFIKIKIIEELSGNQYDPDIKKIENINSFNFIFKIVSIDSINKIEEDILISPIYNLNFD